MVRRGRTVAADLQCVGELAKNRVCVALIERFWALQQRLERRAGSRLNEMDQRRAALAGCPRDDDLEQGLQVRRVWRRELVVRGSDGGDEQARLVGVEFTEGDAASGGVRGEHDAWLCLSRLPNGLRGTRRVVCPRLDLVGRQVVDVLVDGADLGLGSLQRTAAVPLYPRGGLEECAVLFHRQWEGLGVEADEAAARSESRLPEGLHARGEIPVRAH